MDKRDDVVAVLDGAVAVAVMAVAEWRGKAFTKAYNADEPWSEGKALMVLAEYIMADARLFAAFEQEAAKQDAAEAAARAAKHAAGKAQHPMPRRVVKAVRPAK